MQDDSDDAERRPEKEVLVRKSENEDHREDRVGFAQGGLLVTTLFHDERNHEIDERERGKGDDDDGVIAENRFRQIEPENIGAREINDEQEHDLRRKQREPEHR